MIWIAVLVVVIPVLIIAFYVAGIIYDRRHGHPGA
jgi:cell division protein FtsX